jgi:hypothetical protein
MDCAYPGDEDSTWRGDCPATGMTSPRLMASLPVSTDGSTSRSCAQPLSDWSSRDDAGLEPDALSGPSSFFKMPAWNQNVVWGDDWCRLAR